MTKNILKSLLKPEAYPEPTSKVDLIQTHVSWIFLTDNNAYKVKKPVDYGFLNFSTIDRRRFYCNEEIKYNRRLCPDMYEGVVELYQKADGAAFQGDGQVIDYAVKMKRLPSSRMMDILISNNAVSIEKLHEVAKIIAEFHLSAPTSASVSAFGSLDKIMFNWKENIEQTSKLEDRILTINDRETIRNWVNKFAEQYSGLFQQRIDKGFIRECDGDLHLENICLTDDKVYIFDCIEFNERFRNCDTASDIAFLLMDLDYHGRHDLSEVVLSKYLQITGDFEMASLLPFYKTYRAFVRGKVESFRLNEKELDSKEVENITAKAAMYFRLARGYIERQQLGTTLFITCGLMGSGKSTLATQLAFELGIACFNSDIIRKQIAGLNPANHIDDSFREGLYSPENTITTYTELARLAENELLSHRSVIIDACFIHKNYRLIFSELAHKHSASFVILCISCSEHENRRRLHERSALGKSVSDGREELLAQQQIEYEPPSDHEGQLININSTKDSFNATNIVYKHLR